jgi:hypothetical protein
LGLLPLSTALTIGSRQDKPDTRTANIQANSSSDRRRSSSTSAKSPHRYVGNNRQQNQHHNQQNRTGPGRYDYFPVVRHHGVFQNRSFYIQNRQRGCNKQYHYDCCPFVQLSTATVVVVSTAILAFVTDALTVGNGMQFFFFFGKIEFNWLLDRDQE